MKMKIISAVLLASLALISSCGNDRDDYEKAKQANTFVAFHEFLKKYPESNYAVQAIEELEKYKYKYEPNYDSFGVKSTNVILEDRIVEGQRYTVVTVAKGGSVGYLLNKIVYDTPGSENLKIVVNDTFDFTSVAGLRFMRNCTINILGDGSIEVDQEDVRATDEDSLNYISSKIQSKILMVKVK